MSELKDILKHTTHHLKSTWVNHTGNPNSKTAGDTSGRTGDGEYVKLFKKHFPNFEGNILEIGAGTGFLARKIIKKGNNINYTILDIEKNIPYLKSNLSDFEVEFVKSSEYKKVFSKKWDLVVAIHCLSETPPYYYKSIFNNIATDSCFIIDYQGDKNDKEFEPSLLNWLGTFQDTKKFENTKLIGAAKKKSRDGYGIPVYVGRSKNV